MKDDIYDMKRAGQKYHEYLKKNKGNLINVGIPAVDKHTRGIFPGQVFGVMARTATFKTAILQNIIQVNGHKGKSGVLFSLEMQASGIFERAAQMEFDMSGEQIHSIFTGTSNYDDTPDEIINCVYNWNKNIFIVDRARMNIDQMNTIF